MVVPRLWVQNDATMGEYNPVHCINYLLAVGRKHTGYNSLMAGLVTEWIYDAFAGKYSFICITILFNKLYELTNLVLTL